MWRNRCHIFAQRAHKKQNKNAIQASHSRSMSRHLKCYYKSVLHCTCWISLHFYFLFFFNFSYKYFIFIRSWTACIKPMSSGSWCKLLKHTQWNKPVNLEPFGQNLISSLFPSAVVPARVAGVLPGSKVKSNVFIAGYFFRAHSEPRLCKWYGSTPNLLSKLTRGAQTDVMNINPF